MTARTGRAVMAAWLIVVWVMLWGSITFANVLGGIAVAAALLVLFPLHPVSSPGIVRPLALLRFLVSFAIDLVQSSLKVAALVVRPRSRLRQAVLAIPVRGASDQLLTLLANAISLTPGTLTLDVDREASVLFVHVLDVGSEPDGVERVRADILRIERLAILAIGSATCRRALAEDEGRVP
jgi:multicomponent Na+:H+ antiporter subunit E